jgi:hypothetical protein
MDITRQAVVVFTSRWLYMRRQNEKKTLDYEIPASRAMKPNDICSFRRVIQFVHTV